MPSIKNIVEHVQNHVLTRGRRMGGQLRDNLEGEGVGVELLELIEISAGRYKQCFFFSIPSIKPNLVGTWCQLDPFLPGRVRFLHQTTELCAAEWSTRARQLYIKALRPLSTQPSVSCLCEPRRRGWCMAGDSGAEQPGCLVSKQVDSAVNAERCADNFKINFFLFWGRRGVR